MINVHDLFSPNDDNYLNTDKMVKVKKLDDVIDEHLETSAYKEKR